MAKEYYNVLEEIVPTVVNVLLNSPDYQTVCRCRTCTTDIIALTLNSIPPRYITSPEKREIVFRLFNQNFMRTMLNKHIISAIHIVRKNPNHD
ncbi:late competence development ComFB family protein [Pseudalkalibacillus sp. SCS-8]|uniref:late competence development ComFB family protein n=1 Tax=Pseudalkalibacillus nanhaiensis TaxID=3115291 RepID=UPI0032DBC21E